MPTQLSPKERRKFERYLRNVKKLSRKENLLTSNYKFIMRQQTKAALRTLGCVEPDKRDIGDALGIIRDSMPFKKYRLRKLINGRRSVST